MKSPRAEGDVLFPRRRGLSEFIPTPANNGAFESYLTIEPIIDATSLWNLSFIIHLHQS